jgi:hypothetical protein
MILCGLQQSSNQNYFAAEKFIPHLDVFLINNSQLSQFEAQKT